jgi:glycosyltransferase involved in cell wall biosynthesis
MHQDYPHDRMEWIIVDDGTDLIEDLVKDVPGVKYYKYEGEKMPLGKKRNIMHEKSKGDIIVYQDDDDYYPKDRVSHAVETLTKSKHALAAGASEIYIWFKHIQQMYQFGPYSPTHATAGTFAFKRELLENSAYDDTACLAEERKFLKDYTVPFVQLNPQKTILVFSHEHNTFDKRKLLEGTPNPQFCKPSSKVVDDFVKEPYLKNFFMNEIEGLLENYEPGHPRMKPDVLQQIKEIDKQRAELEAANVKIQMQQPDGTYKELNNKEIAELLNKLQKEKEEMMEAMRNYQPTVTLEKEDGTKEVKSLNEIMQLFQQTLQENQMLKRMQFNQAGIVQEPTTNILITDDQGLQHNASTEEIVQLLQHQMSEVKRMETEIQMMQFQIISKNSEINYYEKQISTLQAQISKSEESTSSLTTTSSLNT